MEQGLLVCYSCTNIPRRRILVMDTLLKSNARVAILLGTYHGEAFLEEQLASYEQQTHNNWQLYISDDGFDLSTEKILKKFNVNLFRKTYLRQGPRQGFTKNFLSLACDESIDADYYAFSDQDDIWEAHKISTAINWLKTIPDDVPSIYCSRTCLINHKGEEIGYSFILNKIPSFSHALVQNIASGNTMVFNHAAKKLLRVTGLVDVPSHDWWLYIVVSACGGKIQFDYHPSVRYRQHDNNVIGYKTGIVSKIKGIHKLIKGQLKSDNEKHIQALVKLHPYMIPANLATLTNYIEMRETSLFQRLIKLYKSGVYRQTLFGNLTLVFAAMINRL